MAFPQILIDKPLGTEMVSTIDDYERQTRAWLKQCMKEISGYPSVNTVAVKVWDNSYVSENDLSCPEGKVLLGYNSETKSLQIISSSGADAGLSKAIALLAHPVGSYYETSDASFNPNTAWGGNWELDTPGRVMVSYGTKEDEDGQVITGSHNFTDGEIGGEETHNLIRAELPIHYHPHKHPHAHNITETVTNNNETTEVSKKFVVTTGGTPDGYIPSVAASAGTSPIGIKLVDETGLVVEHAPASSQHGMVDWDNDPQTRTEDTIMHVGSAWQRTDENHQTSANEHNNLQPYKVCYRWHRLPDTVVESSSSEETEVENND